MKGSESVKCFFPVWLCSSAQGHTAEGISGTTDPVYAPCHAPYKGLPRDCRAHWDRHGQLLDAWNYFKAPRSVVTLLVVIMDQSTSFCLNKTKHFKRHVK
jgi:hypothetical protein